MADLEKDEFLSTPHAIKEFKENSVWIDIKDIIEAKIELYSMSLRSERDVEKIIEAQTFIEACETLLALPDTILDILNAERLENERESGKQIDED